MPIDSEIPLLFFLCEAEIHWKEVITASKPQQHEQVSFNEPDLSSKCETLRSNRFTTTWMFQKRTKECQSSPNGQQFPPQKVHT